MTAKKTSAFYLQISLSYDRDIVLPLEKGLMVVEAIQEADLVNSTDWQNKTIMPNDGKEFSVILLSANQVKQMKMANTLLKNTEKDEPE